MGLFGIREQDFQDTRLTNQSEGIARAEIYMSRFLPKFREAQIWLDNRMNLDMMPYVAFRTGRMQTAINARNNALRGTGKLCVYAMPYGRYVYNGVTKSGNEMQYTNPLTTPRWFNTVKGIYSNQWIRGVQDIIRRR